MSKHIHEWVFDVMPMEIRCIDCEDVTMSLDEGERRLNATEILSAEDARKIADADWIPSQEDGRNSFGVLKAYAATLEDGSAAGEVE